MQFQIVAIDEITNSICKIWFKLEENGKWTFKSIMIWRKKNSKISFGNLKNDQCTDIYAWIWLIRNLCIEYKIIPNKNITLRLPWNHETLDVYLVLIKSKIKEKPLVNQVNNNDVCQHYNNKQNLTK